MPAKFASPRSLAVGPALLAIAVSWSLSTARAAEPRPAPIDFNRDIRPILSNRCFQCHGPDARKRKGVSQPLRLDDEAGAIADLGGYQAIVRGKPDESELVRRLAPEDTSEIMPPATLGKPLAPKEVKLLTDWVRQGAPYAKHWSYAKPIRPAPPEVRDAAWSRSPIDRFLLARIEAEGLKPSPEADRRTLIRRLSLDLTGLPPMPDEVSQFIADTSPGAYESLVDRLLAKPTFGEHWARMWLDLARYADSAGYADDPPRIIWPYRDYVVRSLNANKPFDLFTIEQLAGDLLPDPTEEQLVATAFHRNTLTNNEGGTNDEEFRSVAVVDRVNTTMAVWMGTTVACCQCHDHKFDPISQEEYFRLYAFFNNTADADRGDESPTLPLITDEQRKQKADKEGEIAAIEKTLVTPTPTLLEGQARWEQTFATDLSWQPLRPADASARSGAKLETRDDASIVAESREKADIYTLELPLRGMTRLAALRLEALPGDGLPKNGPGYAEGNFVVSRVLATIRPPGGKAPSGRFVRVDLPGKQKLLSLAEVQVFQGSENVAPQGEAKQVSTDYDGPAGLAIDGKTDGNYEAAKSTTHTAQGDDPWWEVDLKEIRQIDRIAVWNRTDNGLHTRLANFRVTLLDADRKPVWTRDVAEAPNPSVELAVSGDRAIAFVGAFADFSQDGFPATSVLENKDPDNKGWAIGGRVGQAHTLSLAPEAPVEVEPGSTLRVTIEQLSKFENHTIGHFRLSASDDPRAPEFARAPGAIHAILKVASEARTEAQRAELTRFYLASVAPELKAARARLDTLKAELATMKPAATVPVQRELATGARRKTNIQRRGSFLDLGAEVTEGVPAAFPPLPEGVTVDRLALARWLVSEDNPLTARVVANRFWEQIFGAGIVPTSEEFGSQGEPPTNPELLDWLATELVRNHWDVKQFLKLLVTSAAYRQDSRISPEQLQADPENRLLARGPRFRLSAETIRDQALAIGGLLSPKMYGPPVRPPQPNMGLSAAFGGGTDWVSSDGEDRHRRGLYTTWRRSNPYPSMATFDAPNREVCIVRRTRTNTPLQALVTLNDPVYVEAAQGLARRIVAGAKDEAGRVNLAFQLVLARRPSPAEFTRIVKIHGATCSTFQLNPEKAGKVATVPLGPAPEGADIAELAAWTVVGNILLNLDETLTKR